MRQRVTAVDSPQWEIYPAPLKQTTRWKPRGLWYSWGTARGTAWTDWAKENMDVTYQYLVPLRIRRGALVRDCKKRAPDSILRIGTLAELDAFTREFSGGVGMTIEGKPHVLIDWAKVARRFAGIECKPYLTSARLTYVWYNMIDVESGCVWHAAAVGMRALKPRPMPRNRRRTSRRG